MSTQTEQKKEHHISELDFRETKRDNEKCQTRPLEIGDMNDRFLNANCRQSINKYYRIIRTRRRYRCKFCSRQFKSIPIIFYL